LHTITFRLTRDFLVDIILQDSAGIQEQAGVFIPNMPNTLYYGDNLSVLREHIPGESVDLIYLDPPFNSSRNYNLLFKQAKGDDSPAQIMAFEDTWT
jgi:adenine specific DNA methylase Mod